MYCLTELAFGLRGMWCEMGGGQSKFQVFLVPNWRAFRITVIYVIDNLRNAARCFVFSLIGCELRS